VWVDDPDFDLGYHLRHVTLDDPSEEGLLRYVGESASTLLDRRHPLWRLVLVDGLHDGRQALLMHWSHTLADGTAGRTTIRRLLTDIDPDELAAVRAAEPYRPAPIRRRTLLVEALGALLRSLLVLPALLWRLRRRTAEVEARRAEAPVVVPKAEDTPITTLNDAWSGRRRVARATVPLDDVRRVKDRAGATVNDVFLAMAAGALRRHLDADGALPDAPLTVNIPMSTEPERPPGAPERQMGNHFSNYLASLATDVDDPVERLHAIRASAREARRQLEVFGPTTLVELLDNIPPALAEPGARWMAADKHAHAGERTDYSVILSNVQGTAAPFSFTTPAGPVSVERTSVFGMVFDGTGLSLVGWTYGDHVELTAVSDADAVADPAPILDGMAAAHAELDAALGDAALAATDPDAVPPTGQPAPAPAPVPAPAPSAVTEEEVGDAPAQR
jgi:WS/DGAT/MGAT family acyltransferase